MSKLSRADTWVHETIARAAQQHFPGRAQPLEETVRRLAAQHEAAWKRSAQGVFRPTASMYAFGLVRELDRLGPNCFFCKGKVEPPTRPSPRGPSGPALSMGPRLPPAQGGLNVPQNLVVGHAECFPGR